MIYLNSFRAMPARQSPATLRNTRTCSSACSTSISNIYAPTKVALEKLFPRIVKGGVIAFDELNCAEFAGETTALLESFDLHWVELKRFPADPYISYFVK